MASQPLLTVKNLKAFKHRVEILHDVSFTLESGTITSILGPNGAGKTLLLNALTSQVPTTGKIIFEQVSLGNLVTAQIAKCGIAHIPEHRGTFPNLSVYENIILGAYTRRNKKEIKEDCEMVYQYFPFLHERRNQLAGTLSGGQQQMLAIARGLMLKPKLMMVDEPSFGLAPIIIDQIFEIILKLNREQHVTILLAEQNSGWSLRHSQQILLLDSGNLVFAGPTNQLDNNPVLYKTYFGY